MERIRVAEKPGFRNDCRLNQRTKLDIGVRYDIAVIGYVSDPTGAHALFNSPRDGVVTHR
jgi:hypothetical protein